MRAQHFAMAAGSILAVSASLSACGSSGSDSGSATTTPVVTTGVVTGSYFRNARVCLDANNNGACDAGETSGVTDANGRFSLSGTGAVVADITLGATRFDPLDGTSTDVLAANRLLFRAPASANGVVNSLSTFLMEDMAASNLSWDAAAKKLADRIGVTVADLARDYHTISDTKVRDTLMAESNYLLGQLRDAAAAGQSNASVLPKGAILLSGKGPQSSDTPYLTPINANVAVASVLTTGDAIGGYRMGGIPDGLGVYDNKDNTFTVLMNHELVSMVARAPMFPSGSWTSAPWKSGRVAT
jgi:hypothetical protein